MNTTIHLGDVVQDDVSGFTGLVTAIGDHISGCERIGVYPIGEAPSVQRGEREFFFEDQLTTIDDDEVDFSEDAANAVTSVDFELGNTVRDTIVDVEGIVTIINYHLWNCPAVAIRPQGTSTDEAPEMYWTDAPCVEYVDDGVADEFSSLTESTETATTGSITDTGNRSLSSTYPNPQ